MESTSDIPMTSQPKITGRILKASGIGALLLIIVGLSVALSVEKKNNDVLPAGGSFQPQVPASEATLPLTEETFMELDQNGACLHDDGDLICTHEDYMYSYVDGEMYVSRYKNSNVTDVRRDLQSYDYEPVSMYMESPGDTGTRTVQCQHTDLITNSICRETSFTNVFNLQTSSDTYSHTFTRNIGVGESDSSVLKMRRISSYSSSDFELVVTRKFTGIKRFSLAISSADCGTTTPVTYSGEQSVCTSPIDSWTVGEAITVGADIGVVLESTTSGSVTVETCSGLQDPSCLVNSDDTVLCRFGAGKKSGGATQQWFIIQVSVNNDGCGIYSC